MRLCRSLLPLVVAIVGNGASPPLIVEASEDVSTLFPGAPRIHSFAFGEWDGHWIFLAGRVSGYHGEGGKEADFPRAEANQRVWVLTPPNTGQPARTWSLPLTKLAPAVVDQWMSTNPQYTQVGDTLYLAGGYGQNAAGKWVTYPILSAVHLPGLIQTVKTQGDLAAHVRYTESPHVQVSGGEMLRLDDGLFYLAGGHKFTGSYRDFETTRGQAPALASQEYTSAVRQLRIDPATLNVELVAAFTDPQFRRRDMNAGHVMMPDGKTLGAALYGGVFTANQLGFTKPVYWTAHQPPQPFAGFDQKMSAYTCAHFGLYDSDQGLMLRTFFGGISGWLWNHEKNAVE